MKTYVVYCRIRGSIGAFEAKIIECDSEQESFNHFHFKDYEINGLNLLTHSFKPRDSIRTCVIKIYETATVGACYDVTAFSYRKQLKIMQVSCTGHSELNNGIITLIRV